MKTVNLLSAIFLFFTLFISCSKEKIITDFNKNLIPSSADFQLNNVSYVLFTQDNGLLIAGVFNGKSTIIKTNFKFETEWIKNDYEWGNIISGSGWGSSFYAPVIKKIFQKDDGTYVCLCSIEEGGDVVYSSSLLIELNKSGEQIRKVGFQDNVTINVLQTNDGGCLLFGSKLIKLDQNYTQQWVKNIFGDT